MSGNASRVLLLSPWGASGGYSGPLTLMNRMWSEVTSKRPDTRVILVYRDRGIDTAPGWADEVVPAVRSQGFGRLAQIRWMLAAAFWVVRYRRSVDVVHLQGTYLTNLLPALFARRGCVVMLPVLENGDLGGVRNSRIKRWIARWIGKHARSGFALSDGIARELRDIGLAEERIARLSNPVDPRMITGEPDMSSPRSPVRLGFIGKLGPLKNPHLLIEAAATLRRRGRPCEAHFFGPFASEFMELKLRGLVDDLDVREEVYFHGFYGDILPAFDAFDIFVLPSTKEGLPGSLMEAFAMGKPVIVTDVGSMAEYVRRADAGHIVRADAAEVANAVLEILEGDAWSAAARSARSFASTQLDPRVVADQYLSQIERTAR